MTLAVLVAHRSEIVQCLFSCVFESFAVRSVISFHSKPCGCKRVRWYFLPSADYFLPRRVSPVILLWGEKAARGGVWMSLTGRGLEPSTFLLSAKTGGLC